MGKNIVLLSDGTGNSAAKLFKTNVWRLSQALELSDGTQIVVYDDGVGTGRFKPLALLGSAIGLGLSKNVRDLYAFLCRNYRDGDKIFAFGFSRGAFTIRVLIGLIHSQGLVKATTEPELRRGVRRAFKNYRKGFKTNIGQFIAKLRREPERPRKVHEAAPKIAFVGLWDTVDAYGLPVEELKKGIYYWMTAWSFPDRKLSQIVERACHALALDDERRTFHPLLWDERDETERAQRHGFDPQRLKQVWFVGAHSNVGGGYPEDGLSYISLDWIMRESEAAGLRYHKHDMLEFARLSDWNADLYDSRSGLAGYYRYDPRNLAVLCKDDYHEVFIDRPKIHESVFLRIKDGTVGYAPTGIPATYDVMDRDGEIIPGDQNPPGPSQFEHKTQSKRRELDQETARDWIWWRRVVYLATVAVSLYLALFPVVHPALPNGACTGRFCFAEPALSAVEAVAPGWLDPWFQSFRQAIDLFLFTLVGLAAFVIGSVKLRQRIIDQQARNWADLAAGPKPTKEVGRLPRSLAYWMRTSRPLVATYRWLARTVLPFLFAIAIIVASVFAINKIATEALSSFGFLCEATPNEQLTRVEAMAQSISFETRQLCYATGLGLDQGAAYDITVKTSGWRDKGGSWFDESGLDANADGLRDKADVRRLALFVPLRRSWNDPWFRLIARIGDTGSDEYGLGERPVRITARSTGELFLFVNDAVIVWPPSHFYRHNEGSAMITIRRVSGPEASPN